LRSNCVQKFVALGWAGNAWGAKHVLEGQFDYTPKKDIKQLGIFGQPAYLRYGSAWKLKSGALNVVARLGQSADVSAKLVLPVQDGVNVTIEERCNYDHFVKGNSGEVNYQWGFGVELKL